MSDSDSVRLEKVKAWFHKYKESGVFLISDTQFKELEDILYQRLSGYKEVKING